MPPKGGKRAKAKDATVAAADDEDHESGHLGIQDLEVPKSTIAKIAKANLPAGAKLTKDIPSALVRASTVFISYLSAMSHDVASERNHKTVTANHVLEAVKMLDWQDEEQMLAMLQSQLKSFKNLQQAKKQSKAAPLPSIPAPVASTSTTDPNVSTETREDVAMEAAPTYAQQIPDDGEESFGELDDEVIDLDEVDPDFIGEEEDEDALQPPLEPDVEDTGLVDDNAHLHQDNE